jgi:hypothetical protein
MGNYMSRIVCGRIKPGLGEDDTIKIEGDLEVNEDLNVTGDLTVTGDLNVNEDLNVTGVPYYNGVRLTGAWDVIIEDQKPPGAQGGSSTSNVDMTRDLNTLTLNEGSMCSLSSNRFTLPAGTYDIEWISPTMRGKSSGSWLWNVTSSIRALEGTSDYQHVTYGGHAHNFGAGRITIASASSFEIRTRVLYGHATWGLGNRSDDSGKPYEVYTRVKIKRVE